MKDYTDAQTAPMPVIDEMPSHECSQIISELGQREYQRVYGIRTAPDHHVATERTPPTWHFTWEKWKKYFNTWPDNQCVFTDKGKLVGWLLLAEIQQGWFRCNSTGYCYDGALRPMETYRPHKRVMTRDAQGHHTEEYVLR